MRLRRSAPDTAALLVHAAAASLNSHGMRAVIDDVEDDYVDVFNPSWTADRPARDGVLLFAGSDEIDRFESTRVHACESLLGRASV